MHAQPSIHTRTHQAHAHPIVSMCAPHLYPKPLPCMAMHARCAHPCAQHMCKCHLQGLSSRLHAPGGKMAPADGKTPKAAQRARELLAKDGLEPSGPNLKKVLPKDEFNKLASSFRNTMSESVKSGYVQAVED